MIGDWIHGRWQEWVCSMDILHVCIVVPSIVSASHVENRAVLSFFCLIESQLLSPKWGNLSKLIHYNQIHFNVNSCDSRPMYLNYRVVCLCICAVKNGFIYYSGCILGERCTICFFWCSSLQCKRFMFKSINTPYEAVSFSTSLPCFLPLAHYIVRFDQHEIRSCRV